MSDQMYSFDENTGSSFSLPAGIHENVKLVNIVFEPLKEEGEKTLRFKFEKDGASFTHTEFSISKVIAGKYAKVAKKQVKDVLKQMGQEQGERIKHILVAFYPDRKVSLEGNSWEDFCTKYIALAADLYKEELFRIKTVYTNKGFTTFPNRAISPFIQNMQEAPAIVINPKYDRMVPPLPSTSQGEMYPTKTEEAPANDLQF